MSFITEFTTWANKQKFQIAAYFILVFTFIAGALYIKDLRTQNKALTSQVQTLDEKFKQIGSAYQAQGQIYQTDKQAWEAAQAAQGKALADQMKQDQAQLRALFQANGELKAELGKVSPVVVVPTTATGAFANVSLPQVRKGPSLTSVTLSYDPTNSNLKGRLVGNWNNNREDFAYSVGEWQKKDKGYIATVKLSRTVYDSSDKQVGTEEIPLTNATASFGPDAFGGEQALNPIPRLTVYGGVGKDTNLGKVVSVLGADYRFTTTTGVGVGVVGSTIFGSVSYRFGK